MKHHPQSSLPPGFRFHPTDEELILHYLKKKLSSSPFPVSIIADVDIYKFNPWDLPDKAAFGEKEWYFFSPRDRKYPNGARPNRAAASGYWKATGTDKVIVSSSMADGRGEVQENIGVKKALVFYKGRPPKGIKTNWIMHEYRLADNPNSNFNNRSLKSKDSSMRLDDWVLCRIYKKTNALSSTAAAVSAAISDQDQEEEEAEQFIKDALLPAATNNALQPQKSRSFSNLLDATDYLFLSSLLADNEPSSFTFSNSEQPLVSNYTTSGNNISSISSNSSSMVVNKLPQLSSSLPNMENKLKRQYSNIDDHDYLLNPSKKPCSYSNSSNQIDMTHYNFLNQPLFNQSLLLSPHIQFQG